MRVTAHFGLAKTQPEVDFVDVDLATDVRIFVDPRALRRFNTPWGQECVALIQDFFRRVLRSIHEGDDETAVGLLRMLREPNETHLGFSTGQARGRGLGSQSARDVGNALKDSEAAKSGLLQDLEDTVLMVPGVASDIVSDIATNVIRQPLIRYTQEASEWYGIPVTSGVASGPMWDPQAEEWFEDYVDLPIVDNRRLLLVPKSIVRRRMDFDVGEYYRHFILPALQARELEATTELVRLVGKVPHVTKSDLIKKYGQGKQVAIDFTLETPELLETYRASKAGRITPPLNHEGVAAYVGVDTPDWDTLLQAVTSLPPGPECSDRYHRSVEALLTAVFYPALSFPRIEERLHSGRKRIDISYANIAEQGFFRWLGNNYPSQHVFIECKNYSADPANPEVDQLAGRFSPNRGQFGILAVRTVENRELLQSRLRDTASDDRGFIIFLDDDDLRQLVEARKRDETFGFLKEKFDHLIM